MRGEGKYPYAEIRNFTARRRRRSFQKESDNNGIYSSTFVEMITGYRSMARRFHPDNNYGFDTSEIMTMINTAKEGLKNQLRKNDAVREEEVT